MRLVFAICVAGALGCAAVPHLKETEPVEVTGTAVAPTPPLRKPSRVEVKDDRIDVSETIQFDFSSSRISNDSHTLLDEIASVITKHPDIRKIRIEGHTDNSGDSPHNLSLSKKRAAAVMKYLVEQGVEAERLTAEGYGQSKPIADNATEDGRAKNRRVAFVILERGAAKGGGKAKHDDQPDDSSDDKRGAKPEDDQ